MQYKERICGRCVMDSSVPGIRFTSEGTCNYCTLHDQLDSINGHRQGTIDELCDRIRKTGKNLEYDCVVGLSGGMDSTYCLYIIKKRGLRPLAVHFDNGWVSDTAKANIEATAEKMKVKVRRVTVDWETLRTGYRACLEASTPDVCMPCEIGGLSALYSVAAEIGVRYVILGLSYRTEGINPLGWHYVDGLYLSEVLKKYAPAAAKCSYNKLRMLSLGTYILRHGIRTIQLPLYIQDYRDNEIREILARELGWVYGGYHHFDCTYKPFVSRIHNDKFNADLRAVSLSAQVRTGELSREEALSQLQQPIGVTDSQVQQCLNRLGLTQGDFERILAAPVKNFRDYRTHYSLISRMKLPLKMMSRMGIIPETTYEKMFES